MLNNCINFENDIFQGGFHNLFVKNARVELFHHIGKDGVIDSDTMNKQSIVIKLNLYKTMQEYINDEDGICMGVLDIKPIWTNYENFLQSAGNPLIYCPETVVMHGTVQQLTGITFAGFRRLPYGFPKDVFAFTYENDTLFKKDEFGIIIDKIHSSDWPAEKIHNFYVTLCRPNSILLKTNNP